MAASGFYPTRNGTTAQAAAGYLGEWVMGVG